MSALRQSVRFFDFRRDVKRFSTQKLLKSEAYPIINGKPVLIINIRSQLTTETETLKVKMYTFV